MARSCFTPAAKWRAFFVAIACALGAPLLAAPSGNPPPPLARLGKPDQEDGRAALQSLRRLGISGSYFLEFQLRVMPRRGDERLIRGRLWGSRNSTGPVSRVSLQVPADGALIERRLLIQNGAQAAAWRRTAMGQVEVLGVASLFEPVVPETELTAFDLMMPFIYWNDFTYEGLTRFRGRPAHVILLRPPAEFAARHGALKGVRVQLDAQFNALVQSELLGAGDVVMKTLSLVDLKKVGDQWIPRTFDVRDEVTRNKTRFDVTAVALAQDFSSVIFEPGQLAAEVTPPETTAITRLNP